MKYMGSKKRIAHHILHKLEPYLKEAKRYVEPFAGGMNMIEVVPSTIPRVAGDNNFYLIEMFKALQRGWKPPDLVTKDEYYSVKFSETVDPALKGWVGFNCSYAGKWFDGYAGVTKTATGIRDYQEEARRNLDKQMVHLRDVEFVYSDYRQLKLEEGDLVYCDKPYENSRGYKVKFDHEEFWDWAREQSSKVPLFVSEYRAPDDFEQVMEIPVKSSISANAVSGGSQDSVEKLFVRKGSKAQELN